MSKFSYKGYATRIAVILVSVFLIVYFLPRENRFGYEYELNRPWKYGQLIASYDFPIAKTDAELKDPDTFADWDDSIWNFAEGEYPSLREGCTAAAEE